MAMIICEKCGQAVSDKSTFCPHCGAPMEDEVATSRNENEDDDAQEGDNRTVWMIASAAGVLILAMLLFSYCKRGGSLLPGSSDAQNEKAGEIMARDVMLAPRIALDSNGGFSLQNCPVTHEGLTLEKLIDADNVLSAVKVIKYGQFLQILIEGEDANDIGYP